MAIENVGVFFGDSEGSVLLTVFALAPEELDELSLVLTAADELLKRDEIYGTGGYLHYSNREVMEQDNAEGSLYDILPSELETATPVELPSDSKLREATLIKAVLHGYSVAYGDKFSATFGEKVGGAFTRLKAKKAELETANKNLEPGTPVYLGLPFAGKHPDTAVPFDPRRHDSRKVLPTTAVKEKPAGALTIYPLPPELHKDQGAFWGHFTDLPAKQVSFRGRTQRDLKKKAALYEAWVARFGV